jgi:hypothetical protein
MTDKDSLVSIIDSIFKCEEAKKIYKEHNLKSTLVHIYDDIDIPEMCLVAIGRIRKPVRIESRRELSDAFDRDDNGVCRDTLVSLVKPLEDMLFEGEPKLSVVRKED